MNTRHFLGRSARTAAVLVVGLMSTFGAVSAASTADAARMTTGPGPGRKACSPGESFLRREPKPRT